MNPASSRFVRSRNGSEPAIARWYWPLIQSITPITRGVPSFHRWFKRQLLRSVLLITASAGVTGSWAGVEYIGLNKAHLSYSGGGFGTFRLELRRNDHVLVDVRAGSFSGHYNDIDLAPGVYTYRIYDHYYENNPPRPDDIPQVRITDIATAKIDGSLAQGRPLFDETLTSDRPLTVDIYVEKNLKLALSQASDVRGMLWGSGLLELDAVALGKTIVDFSDKPVVFAGPVEGGIFHFAHPQDIEGLRNATIQFADGSGLSGFSECIGLDVSIPDCSVSFNQCTGTVLRIQGKANVVVDKGSIQGWFCSGSSGAQVLVSDADVDLASWSNLPLPYPDLWEPASSVLFKRCQVFNRGVCYLYPKDVEYLECIFQEDVIIHGGRPLFTRCEFGAPVTLEDRTAATFKDCIFHQALVFDRYRGLLNLDGTSPWGNVPWWLPDPTAPTVTGNSFQGHVGPVYSYPTAEVLAGEVYPPSTAIQIGPSYYGETTGPELIGVGSVPNQPEEFLSGLGAKVAVSGPNNARFFVLDPFLSSGRRSSDRRIFPSFWLDGWIAGQHALDHRHQNSPFAHSRIQGKETLLSVLVGASVESVRGVKLRVQLDGRTVSPAPGSPDTVVRGSLGTVSPNLIANGQATFNFVLPPVDEKEARLQVWLDTTGVTGYPDAPTNRAVMPVIDTSLQFSPPVATPLRLLVQPIHIIGYGSPGDAPGFALRLNDLIASMLPLGRDRDIDIRVASTALPYSPGADYSYALSLYPLAATIAAASRLADVGDWLIGTRYAPHFTVALLPAGALGQGVEGVNMKVFRGTLFVTEDKLKAAIHELGHAGPGLYTSTEQYDMPPYKATGGKLLQGVTAFVNESQSPLDVQARGRFIHLAKPGYAWKSPVQLLDIMGAIEPSWIDPGTLSDFRNWLLGYLGASPSASPTNTAPGPAKASVNSVPPKTAPLPGIRRVFLSMQTVKHPSSSRHLPDLGTVRLFDTTSFAQRTSGAIGDPAYSDYHLEGFDATGRTVFLGGINLTEESYPSQPPPADFYSWSATCDIPESAVRLVLRNQKQPDITYFDHHLVSGLSTQIQEPGNNSVLGDRVVVRWNAQPTSESSLRSQPLQHMLVVSYDNGSSWEPASGPLEGASTELSTLNWPSGNRISLRLLSSDGFRTAEARVNNLTLPNRPPRIEIVTPRNQDQAVGGFGWTLQARVTDPDGNGNPNGTWSSSRDGILGTSSTLHEVVLSAGEHTLTYLADDTLGAIARASVTVRVAASGGLPIPLSDHALTVVRPGKDRYQQSWVPLQTGQPHQAILSIRAQGESLPLRLRLYLKPPGEAETLLVESMTQIHPLAVASISSDFIPARPGAYELRSTLERDISGNPDMENPVWTAMPGGDRTWSYSTLGSGPLSVITEGQGTVVIAPEGIECGPLFQRDFVRGDMLLLLAIPSPGWVFDGWTGVEPSGLNSAFVIAGAQPEVRARFIPGIPVSTGSLLVRLRDALPGAVHMKWRLPGISSWMAADSILEGLPAGSYLIEFQNVPEYPEAPPQLVEIQAGTRLLHEYTVPVWMIETLVQPNTGGWITGGGRHLPGSEVVLVARPATNHLFDGWSEGGLPLSYDMDLVFDSTRHRQIIAHFRESIALSTLEDIQKIGQDPAYPPDKTYHLTNPVDASDSQSWNGGKGFLPIAFFSGTFDGRGHAITGLHIHRPGETNVGLFSRNHGSLSSLVIRNGYMRGETAVGGLVGQNTGLIEDCELEATVVGTGYVGGLVGRNREAGGVIRRCSASGTVAGGTIAGGLIGLHEFGASVSDAHATATVSGTDRVGGLIGRMFEASVARCYSTGPVTGSGALGGLVGGKGIDDQIQNSFWDFMASGQTHSSGGTGQTTEALWRRATFETAGWDLDAVWGILEGAGYPFLRRPWHMPSDPPRPPQILDWRFDADGPYLILLTEKGRLYTIEKSLDLIHWTEITTKSATTEATPFQPSELGDWQAQVGVFYRAKASNP
ncbi:MAG TPA: GLUG motif-containing protein [Candidatus Paceibacterota bacterium]|nr:GLUG motif-containing protein [Candidatus Paceibacterota bacterium]